MLKSFIIIFILSGCNKENGIGFVDSNEVGRLVITDTISYSGFIGGGSLIYVSIDDQITIGLFNGNSEMVIWVDGFTEPQSVRIDDPLAGFGGSVLGIDRPADSNFVDILYGDRIVKYDIETGAVRTRSKWQISQFFPLPPSGDIFKPVKVGDQDGYVFRSYELTHGFSDPEFFKQTRGLTCLSPNDNTINHIGGFDEASIYRNVSLRSEFHVIFDVINDTIYYLRPYERDQISVASCPKGVFDQIEIKAEHHPEFTFYSNGNKVDEISFKQGNAVYISLLATEKYIYTQYREPLYQEDVLPNLVDYNEVLSDRISYIDVYDRKTGAPIMLSIEVPSCFYRLVDVSSKNELVFSRLGKCTEALELYIGTIKGLI